MGSFQLAIHSLCFGLSGDRTPYLLIPESEIGLMQTWVSVTTLLCECVNSECQAKNCHNGILVDVNPVSYLSYHLYLTMIKSYNVSYISYLLSYHDICRVGRIVDGRVAVPKSQISLVVCLQTVMVVD
jgi:hypothetical protein